MPDKVPAAAKAGAGGQRTGLFVQTEKASYIDLSQLFECLRALAPLIQPHLMIDHLRPYQGHQRALQERRVRLLKQTINNRRTAGPGNAGIGVFVIALVTHIANRRPHVKSVGIVLWGDIQGNPRKNGVRVIS
jgi:hypothetical protein